MYLGEQLVSKGLVPDGIIRAKIRKLLRIRLSQEKKNYTDQIRLEKLLRQMSESPIALNTNEANRQHYELPTAFFQKILGKHLKYSSCYWTENTSGLDEAETEALSITCQRAQLQNGQSILELGCGWGSLSLFMAERYPEAQITSVSNSSTQKKFIENQCALRNIKNLQIITADMNVFDTDKKFDRVISVEMFEHMRNWRKLMSNIRNWLTDDGKLFVHIFTHKSYTYFYEITDESDWMAKYFFTGGMMPGDNLLQYFPEILSVQSHWVWSGLHYSKTAKAWLQNMDSNREAVITDLKQTYGNNYRQWWNYWRIFFMACEELWKYNNGNEWLVSHYLLGKNT